MLKITKNQGSIQVTADKSGFYPFDGTITFPTNSLFTATSANTDMITFKSTSNGDVQFVGNYKDITISGRSYDTKQKFLTAFSNLANQGSVDAYTKAETDAKIDAKQGKLKAGNGITLTEDATDNTTVVKTAVSLTDNGNGAYEVGNSIKMGSDTVVIGKSAISRSETSIAIGKSATSGSGGSNVAIGNIANSSGGSSIAIGDKTETSNISTIAIGTLAGAYLPESIAIGYNAKAVTNKPMVINAGGKTMIQSDANGKISLLKGDGTDERMVIQDEIEALKNAGGGSANPLVNVKGTGSATITDTVTEAVAIGSGASVTNDSCIAIGKDTSAQAPTGQSSIVIGSGAKVTNNNADGIVIGSGAEVNWGKNSVVIGNQSYTYGKNSVMIGFNTYTYDDYNVNIGSGRGMKGTYNVAVGPGGTYPYNQFGGKYGIAIGYGSHFGNFDQEDLHKYDIAIGYESQAPGIGVVAIGRRAQASNDNPLVINAGYKTVDGNDQPLTVLQSDANGKISLLKGDGTDERIVIQDALSAGGSGGGTVDAYTKTETDNLLNAKQNTLTAGTGITIDENNVISSTGGSGGSTNPYVNVKGTNESATIAADVTSGIAIGNGASVTGDSGVCVGYKCASVVNSLAVGKEAYALGASDVAIGNGANTKSSSDSSIAIGYSASANGSGLVAIGQSAETNDTTPLVINAGYCTDDEGFSQVLTVLQSDSNGKISIPLGDGTTSTMCLQDEIAALKAEIAALKGGASSGDTTGA